MFQLEYDNLSQKKINLLNNYLDMIMKSMESQYGYIIKVGQYNNQFNYERLVEMYYMSDVKTNLLMDVEFNFLEDINSTLEFYHQEVLHLGKPMIINDFQLNRNLFTFENCSIYENSAWFIFPVHHYDEIVAIIGLIGNPVKFNIFYYEMFQPFMILCSELISSILN